MPFEDALSEALRFSSLSWHALNRYPPQETREAFQALIRKSAAKFVSILDRWKTSNKVRPDAYRRQLRIDSYRVYMSDLRERVLSEDQNLNAIRSAHDKFEELPSERRSRGPKIPEMNAFKAAVSDGKTRLLLAVPPLEKELTKFNQGGMSKLEEDLFIMRLKIVYEYASALEFSAQFRRLELGDIYAELRDQVYPRLSNILDSVSEKVQPAVFDSMDIPPEYTSWRADGGLAKTFRDVLDAKTGSDSRERALNDDQNLNAILHANEKFQELPSEVGGRGAKIPEMKAFEAAVIEAKTLLLLALPNMEKRQNRLILGGRRSRPNRTYAWR